MKKIVISLLIVIMFSLAVVLWWQHGLSAVNPQDKTQKIFVIQKGESMREIASSLKENGFIKDPVVFFLLVKKLGLDGKIQAGDFRLSSSMKTVDVAESLTHGTLDIWITIPEGQRADEIADLLSQKIPSFQLLWRKTLEANEGYLFPDTYLIPRDATIHLVVALMRANFEKKYTQVSAENSTGLSKNDVVILASIVEREARFSTDRPLVASVLLNRMYIGMPLGVDATVQYVLGYQPAARSWWKKDLTIEDLKINSPYNTRVNAGLPPTPISNPGVDTLTAVLTAPKTEYIYYVSDANGHLHFAKTLDEHNANSKKYGL